MLSIELHTAATSLVIPTIRTVAADLAARAEFAGKPPDVVRSWLADNGIEL